MVRTSKFAAKFLAIALFVALIVPVPAQRAFSGAAEMEQALHRLNELGTVLMIAAHPDDERTAVLAYFARGRYMRTAYLSVTRGEGGQNLIGSELGDQLGIIRTQELLDARKIDGAEQFFTRAIDFGFTKTAAETMQKWGHERTLGDVVWVMRRYRPDVVILGFSGTPQDGHGQHQSSAILGKEAFEAAADPKRFPEQLTYAQPWRARRLVFANFSAFGGRGAPAGGARPIPAGAAPTGDFNPMLGYSYEELAVISRSLHHSQGTGAMRRPGPGKAEFDFVAGDSAVSKDLFDGIDTTWKRLPNGAAVGAILAEAIRGFQPAHPEKSIPQLAKARPLIAAIDDPLARVKLAELDEAIALCGGLWVDAQPRQAEVTPGSELTVTTTVLNRSTTEFLVESVRLEGFAESTTNHTPPVKLGYNQSSAADVKVAVPPTQPYSQPYWLVKPHTADTYSVDDQQLVGLPDTPPVLRMRARLSVAGVSVELVRPVRYRYASSSEGERERPLMVVPAVAVNLPERSALFPSAAPRKLQISVKANAANAAGEIRLDVPAGWKSEPPSQKFQVAVAGQQQEVSFTVTPPAAEATASLRAIATVGGREIAAGMKVISYPHIPAQTLFPPAEVKLARVDIQVTVRRVGYIMGAGDAMPEALRQLGLEVALLGQSDLEQGDLSRYDAIVAGVRAYEVRTDLRANHPRLMQYVNNGGTYVVQYQSPQGGFPGGGRGQPPAPMNIGPYPITIPPGNGFRVTVEEAPVTFTHPDSRPLQAPNRITAKDFEGWVQERGLYFATQWDPRYETVMSSNDPGEPPLAGGELWTRFGKGVYIFTAYSWFRQLPAGVPGAYRLFANLLSAR